MNENLSLRDEINTLKEKEKRAESDLRQWQREYHIATINQDVLEEHNDTLKKDLSRMKEDLRHMKTTSFEEMAILAAEKEKAQTAYNQAFRDNIMIRENITHLKVQLDIYRDKLKEYDSCDEIDYALPMMEPSEYGSEDEFQSLRRSKSEPWIEFPPMYMSPKVDMYPLSCAPMSPGSGALSYSPLSSPFRRWYGYQGHDSGYTPPLRSIHQEMRELDHDYDSLELINEIENMNNALLSESHTSATEKDDDQNYMLHILGKIIENQNIALDYLIHDNIVSLSDVTVEDHVGPRPGVLWLHLFLDKKATHSEEQAKPRADLIVYGSKKKIFTNAQKEREGMNSYKVVQLGGRAKAYYSKTDEMRLSSQSASGDSNTRIKSHHKGSWLLKKLKTRKVVPHV